MKVLTIVVPSYNTSVHINACLPTMIDNQFIDKIEILLINDGSTDQTETLLKQYEKKYPDSIRVISKENGGHGSVINRGIQEATGKYFRVVDGDDPLITKNLNGLINKMSKLDSDIVFTPYYQDNIGTGERALCCTSDLKMGVEYKFEDVAGNLQCIPLHAISFKTSLLRDNHIHVQEKCFYEDEEYILYPIPYVNTITYYSEPVYIYRIGVPGQSISVEKVIKNRKMLETITENLCLFYEREVDQGLSKGKELYLSSAICDVIRNMYGMFLKMPRSRETMSLINEFNKKCGQWSPTLYLKSGEDTAINLIRKNNYLLYSCAHVLFKQKMKKRGF